MSWSIALIENTAIVPLDKREELARWLVGECPDNYAMRSSMVYDDQYFATAPAHEILSLVFGAVYKPDQPASQTILFDKDNMEHMDFVTHDDAVCQAIARAGARGRILFGSLEGDNKSSFWGVEFASGHYRRLTATAADINWSIGTSIPG